MSSSQELNNRVDMRVIAGTTIRISLVLSDAGVPISLADHNIYFGLAEPDRDPWLEVKSEDVEQTIITVVEATGSIEVKLPPTHAQPPFKQCAYMVGSIDTNDDVDAYIFGVLTFVNPHLFPVAATYEN
jgi:hypothetical protein